MPRKLTRRSIPLLFAAPAAAMPDTKIPLPSKVFRFEDMPVRVNGKNKSRAILEGASTSGFPIEIHMTELAPGMMPHGSHKHAHAEMVIIEEGSLEITIEGKSTVANAGSVAYIAPNEEHGVKNAGTGQTRYFILALGRERA